MRLIGIWFVVITATVLISSGLIQAGDVKPDKRSGIFWIDRWGQGRFPGYAHFADEKLFPKLCDHIGVPVRLASPEITWEDYDRPGCVVSIGGVERLPNPIQIRLRWLSVDETDVTSIRRLRNSQEATFQAQLVNQTGAELSVDSSQLMFLQTVRHPPGAQYGALSRTFRDIPGRRERGILRYYSHSSRLSPRSTALTGNPLMGHKQEPSAQRPVVIRRDATHTWKVMLSNWAPNEYELMFFYNSPDGTAYSNPLSLDVLTDEPRQDDDVIEMRVRLRDGMEFKGGQLVPLEIVLQNKSKVELRFPLRGTKDDLDLSDFFFCYGDDGRRLKWTHKVSGPTEIRISVGGSFALPVNAPTGTVVARAVFLNGWYAPPLGRDDPKRFNQFWHWSQHWVAPSIRQTLEASK